MKLQTLVLCALLILILIPFVGGFLLAVIIQWLSRLKQTTKTGFFKGKFRWIFFVCVLLLFLIEVLLVINFLKDFHPSTC